jgi:hypothetical protein
MASPENIIEEFFQNYNKGVSKLLKQKIDFSHPFYYSAGLQQEKARSKIGSTTGGYYAVFRNFPFKSRD